MKKFIKLVAFVVDMMFLPVRLVAGTLTLVCGCIVHEWDMQEMLKAMIQNTIYDFKIGFKPTMEAIFKD